jgi:two-component system CheB/CheR fusion protein
MSLSTPRRRRYIEKRCMDTESPNLRVVGIGASAGGIEALREFFDATPADTGMAFVVIQHLDPTQPSYMAGLLSRHTQMKVSRVEDGTAVQSNHVYTIPSNAFMSIGEGKLRLTEPVKRDGLKMPIDFFFRSLAEDQRENAIAVLFSGSGSDGTQGIREIRAMGGLVIVQEPNTAQFNSMIENALATGLVDYTLPVQQIPGAIVQYVRQHDGAFSPTDRETAQNGIDSILYLLAAQTKNDFRCYKPATIYRRIQRRMGLNQVNDIADYYRFLSNNPVEVAKLSKDMLIGVTSFFRDPEAFDELREKVIAPLLQAKYNTEPLRAWAAGCATGEEAYSIVMLLMEEMARARKNIKLQVFASDIDPDALKSAREGIYPQSIAVDLSEERLARFFIKQDSTYQIDKQVREAVVFALHNVLLDPPFLNMELITCRNLLIYIEPEMQKKVLSLFAFALKPNGYLFLGRSENPVEQNDMFEQISKNSRILRRKPSVAAPVVSFALRPGLPAITQDRIQTQHPMRLSDLNQQVLLKHFNASIVLVDENGEIRHFYGPTHKYLSHAVGDATLNLFEMAEMRHSPQLRLLVERAARENDSVRLEALEFRRDDGRHLAHVTVTPVVEPRSRMKLFAVIFEEVGTPITAELSRAPETEILDDTLMARLEAENKLLKEELQATNDSFQSVHEELTATNEEVLAINEELQSTNEELITTNNQLNDKVEELRSINDDLANFLNSSEVRTIFLDRKLCIRRFTPSAMELMNLLSLDVGRPLSHISSKFIDTDLVAIADGVLKSLMPVEKEILTSEGLWFMLCCLPYRTSRDIIDGVVFTFTDVTRLKRYEEAIIEARDYAENIIDTTREALLVLDPDLRIVSANRAFNETFGVSAEETEDRLIYELGNGQWNIPRLRELLERILPTNSVVHEFEVKHDFPSIGPKIMSLNVRRFFNRAPKDSRLILLAISDITERRRLEDELRQNQKIESMGTLAAGVAHDLNNILNIIQGYASVIGGDAEPAAVEESIRAITETTTRGAALVRQLLTLAHKTETKLEPLDVNKLVEGLRQLLKETFPRNIELALDLARDLPLIMADPNQITQVLLNLSVNARDAMPDGGKLKIKTLVSDREGLRERSELTSDRYVCIEVTDTGEGMDENVRSRIFEPFFTTKGIGQGTGLGLAVAYGIVKSHNGFIQVESRPLVGTTFRLHLPVHSPGG